jgi:hypothetical protein
LLASSIPQEVHNALLDQAHSLAQKHVQVSYLLIGVLGLVLTLMGGGAYFAAKWVDRAMARAEKSEELYKADKVISDKALADLSTQLVTSNAARLASEQKILDLQKQIGTIAANANKEKGEVLKPGKTASEAYADAASRFKLTTPLNIVPSADKTEQLLAFRIPDVQQFTVTKIDLNAALQTIQLKDAQLKEKDAEITTLKADLAKSGDALTKLQTTDNQCQDTVKKYKDVAKVSRIRRIFNGALKPVIFAAGFAAGYTVGKHF